MIERAFSIISSKLGASKSSAPKALVIAITSAAMLSGCATATQDSSSAPNSAANSSVKTTGPMASVEDYTRVCGICHLPSGEGVPGAFPPLNARLAVLSDTDEGRNYLVGVLKNGLYGQINVAGTTYSGAMPPVVGQLDAEGMAGMLNYVMSTFAGASAGFDSEEITTRSQAIGSTSSASMRKALGDTL